MTRTLGLGTRVDRLLAKKGHRVVAVNTNVTICDAARTMTQNRVGSVIVRSGTCVVGLLTERDCVERVVARNLDPARTRVHEVMDPEVHAVTLNETVANCLALMTRRRSRHVTVTEGDRLMGILSIGDCVAFLCDRLREENRDLLEYITGRYPG